MRLFWQFFVEGFFHIMAFDALDHILFILSFIAIYDLTKWKQVLWIVTSFTVAHSLSLALSVLNLVHVNSTVIEVLIAFTICFTCIENIFIKTAKNHRVIVTGFFGLIHGLGFSNALKSLFMGMDFNLFETLLPFNLGIECAQLIIISFIFMLFTVIYKYTKADTKVVNLVVSIPTLVISCYWIVIRTGLFFTR